MLLRITVLQYKGAPPATALAYIFDVRGGSIGREDCNLTLPDATRVLSRVQAQIVFADGLFKLLDQGGNPSVVNSLRVGRGNSRVLYDGDIIEIGDYKLRVKSIGSTVPANNVDSAPQRTQLPMPGEELAPPILLDHDELVGGAAPIAQLAPAPDTEVDALEMTFDMDVDFDDDEGIIAGEGGNNDLDKQDDPNATVGIDSPMGLPHGRDGDDTPDHAFPEVMLAAHELQPDMSAEQAAMLTSLCLGLGLTAPEIAGKMLPQHMGIVMRRAMQQALAGVLERFTPADLEKRLADRALLLETPPPLDRKSKLWELFEQRHAEISHEAEDYFHSLFGSEFRKACEAQVDHLQEHN
ncbi:MAG: hypothetical protein JWL63_2475 [Rhodocyclales bacterium]|nr:hypothetical protein [Rhodocyclales bacterium]